MSSFLAASLIVIRSPITARIKSKRCSSSAGTSGWFSYVDGSFGPLALAIEITLDGRVCARKFSVPHHGAFAPAIVGIEVDVDEVAVVGFFEIGEGPGPPLVERRPGLRPRRSGIAIGPGGSTFFAKSSSRSRRRLSCSSRVIFCSSSAIRRIGVASSGLDAALAPGTSACIIATTAFVSS
jgi:hypothetical protein